MKRFFTVFFIFNLVFFVFAQNSNTARKIVATAPEEVGRECMPTCVLQPFVACPVIGIRQDYHAHGKQVYRVLRAIVAAASVA